MTATILFVDDEPDLKALVLQKFHNRIREGTITVMFAHDGIEALDLLERCPRIDLVVSDINMPRMDGLSLLARLQEADELLNEYVGGMTDVTFAHEGTVAKVIGDAIHILFNAPGDQPDYATRAIACAHDLDSWAEDYRARCMAKDPNFGMTRIGVHAGPALVGNFGGGRFFDYTAYSDTINTAARLEVANKCFGTRICVSATIAKRAQDFHGRPVGDLVLRGRSEPLRAYEPLPAEAFKAPAVKQYSEAFAKLEAGNAAAMPAFAALVGQYPTIRWRASISGGCSTAPRASACNWNNRDTRRRRSRKITTPIIRSSIIATG